MSRKALQLLVCAFLVVSVSLIPLFKPTEVSAQTEAPKAGAKGDIGKKAIEKFNLNKTQKSSLDKYVQAQIADADGNANLSGQTANSLLAFFPTLQVMMMGTQSSFPNATTSQLELLEDKFGMGAVPSMSNAIAFMYSTQPASSRTYVADVLHNMNIVPKAQAQGIGFASLDPILETWKVFRNIAYLFFVFLFLVDGIIIMFRGKFGGQKAVTAMQSIWGIFTAFVAVTFSYPLVGFMIDIMYIVLYMIGGLFPGNEDLMNLNIFGLGLELLSGNQSAFDAGKAATEGVVEGMFNGISGFTEFATAIGGTAVGFILSLAVFIGILRLFYELLKSYITVILSTALAPLLLMPTALASGGGNPSTWIRRIGGNLAPFPAVLGLATVYRKISEVDSGLVSGGFMPPYLVGQNNPATLVNMAGIAILLVLPESIVELRKALKADGGIFEQLANTAIGNFKKAPGQVKSGLDKAWKTTKPARQFAGGAALTGGLATAGGLAGGVVGYKTKGLKGVLPGMAIGGVSGGALPAAYKYLPPAANKVAKAFSTGTTLLTSASALSPVAAAAAQWLGNKVGGNQPNQQNAPTTNNVVNPSNIGPSP